MKLFSASLCIIALCAFESCKKSAAQPSVQITTLDSGKTITLVKGQTFSLKIGQATDGGYDTNSPEFDAAVLKITNHTIIPPANPQATGAEGADVWTFTSLQSASTGLKVTAHRCTSDTIIFYQGIIKVQ